MCIYMNREALFQLTLVPHANDIIVAATLDTMRALRIRLSRLMLDIKMDATCQSRTSCIYNGSVWFREQYFMAIKSMHVSTTLL